MRYVYSLGGEFCASIFIGSEKEALANGYKPVTDEMYAKLLDHYAHWVDGELVEREKTPEEIEEEKRQREEEARQEEIAALKGYLAATDYKAIKYAEGWITEEEYAETKAQRQVWRDRINELDPHEVGEDDATESA